MRMDRFAAAVLVLGTILAACGGSPDGEPSPSSTNEPAVEKTEVDPAALPKGETVAPASSPNTSPLAHCVGCPHQCANPPCPDQ